MDAVIEGSWAWASLSQMFDYWMEILIIKQKIMSGKKKSDLAAVLDDLRSEDPKKRLAAVNDLKQVAAALGPARVRGELIPFLAQFTDDDENIVLELLSQLDTFTPLLGGAQQQKCFLPLLIAFCKTDEKKVALRACVILQRVLSSNKELALETLKKLMKTEMSVSKQSAAFLTGPIISAHEGLETPLIESFSTLLSGDNPQHKIICAKYLQSVLKSCKAKQQIGKFLDQLYSEGDELAKIFAIPALIDYYDVNSNSSLTKFKNLSVLNSWRINIKICDNIEAIAAKCSKPHFKLIFEPILLKFLVSQEPELRAASCQALAAIAKNMNEEEVKSKLSVGVKKLAADQVDFVKVQLSKNIVGLCGVVSADAMNQWVLPTVFAFVKDSNSQISLGVMRSFDYLSAKMGKEALQQKIVKPLLQQLGGENWRIKCQIIEILRNFITHPSFLNENVLKMLFALTDDKIDAVRTSITQLIVDLINKNSKDWADQYVVPKLAAMKENASYLKKQNLVDIFEQTATSVSEKTLKDFYQNTLSNYLVDKVPNVRVRSVQAMKAVSKLSTPIMEKQLQKLKDDKDTQVREAVKKLRC